MELKQLSSSDMPKVMSVIKRAFAAEPWNDRWDDDGIFELYIADLTGNASSLSLGLFDEGELIALALGRTKHWFWGTEYCIDDLCVEPACHGRGIGSVFISMLREYSAHNSIARLSLKTSRRAPAYGFYLKNGFAEAKDDVFFELSCN